MAGEIDESFRFNLQADLLHSGSISFGRFESESLSWERRSSFSHNRYLEEVVKYSKPGSVTEKKAYFEAHFRRKALLKQGTSECQDGGDFRTSGNDEPQDLEECKNGNASKHFTSFDSSPQSSGHSEYDETEVQKYKEESMPTLNPENGNARSYVTRFDESRYDEGAKIHEHETKDFGVLSIAPQDEFVINTADHLVSGPEHFKSQATQPTGTVNVDLIKSEKNTREFLNDTVVKVDVASEANDSSLASHTADEDDDSANSRPQRMFSHKVRPASEMKQAKPKLKAHTNVAQVQRIIPNEASNGSAKSKMRGSEGLVMKEKEKKSLRPASPIARSGRKTSKSEESSTSLPKAKIHPQKKSIVKEHRLEKTVEAKFSVLEKSVPGANQTANRTKQTISPSKPNINQGSAGFSFKSDQRAERRKEERKAAEMTQFRKSLNFKATPMPPFYNESARSDRNKVIPTSKTPNKPRTHSTATKTNKFSSNSTASLDARLSSATSSTSKTSPSEPPGKSNVLGKSMLEKKTEASSHKQKEPEAMKGQRARDMLRKDTKGVHMGSGSKLGYLAVGVAT